MWSLHLFGIVVDDDFVSCGTIPNLLYHRSLMCPKVSTAAFSSPGTWGEKPGYPQPQETQICIGH